MGCLRYSSRTSLRYSRHLPTDHHSFPEPATKGATILNSLENECSLCQRRISTERGICPLCHSRVARQLGDLLTFWDAAHDELLPGKSGGGGRSSERTIGLNVNALSFVAGDDILALLHGWEVVIRQDRRLIPPALVPKLAGLRMEIEAGIAFATAHLAWSATQEWFGDFTRELTELHSAGMGAAKLFVKRARRVTCPSTQPDGSYCKALVNVSDRDPLEIFECRGKAETERRLRGRETPARRSKTRSGACGESPLRAGPGGKRAYEDRSGRGEGTHSRVRADQETLR